MIARPVIKVSPYAWQRYSNNLTHQLEHRKEDLQDPLLVGFPSATIL